MNPRRVNLTATILLTVALGFSLWARYGLIESVGVAALCNATSVPLSCTVRNLVIATTSIALWGYVALMAGVGSLIVRRLDVTLLALVTGAMGLVLYAGAPAAVGFLLGCITFVRVSARRTD
jgi:hypothetical protein